MLFSILGQLLAVSFVPLAHAQEVTCWAPDGKTKADNETYVPCNKLGIESEGVFSSCCNLDGDVEDRHRCVANGLCLRGTSFFRGYCTDKNWDSPACVNVCTDDDETGGSSTGIVDMTPCGDGTYCCGRSNLKCCDTDSAVTLPTLSDVISENVTETAFVTEAASSNSAFKGATIGLAVVLGIVALAALLGALWMLKKNKALQSRIQELQQGPPSHMQQTPHSQYADPYLQEHEDGTEITSVSTPRHGAFAPYKPPTSPSVPEVDGSHQRYSELDATSMSPQTREFGTVSPNLDRSVDGNPMRSPHMSSPGM